VRHLLGWWVVTPRRTTCPAGRPLYRYDDLPADRLATRSMLRRRRRALAPGQQPVASYWTGYEDVPLFEIADSWYAAARPGGNAGSSTLLGDVYGQDLAVLPGAVPLHRHAWPGVDGLNHPPPPDATARQLVELMAAKLAVVLTAIAEVLARREGVDPAEVRIGPVDFGRHDGEAGR